MFEPISSLIAGVGAFFKRGPREPSYENRGGPVTIIANRVENAGQVSSEGGDVATQPSALPPEAVGYVVQFNDADAQVAHAAFNRCVAEAAAKADSPAAFLHALRAAAADSSEVQALSATQRHLLASFVQDVNTMLEGDAPPQPS